jgi:hypothetical protein
MKECSIEMQSTVERKFANFRLNLYKEELGDRAYLHDRLAVCLPVMIDNLRIMLIKTNQYLLLNNSKVKPVFHPAVPNLTYFDGEFNPHKDPPIFWPEEKYKREKKKK